MARPLACRYDGIIFDMDGTLSVSVIDYALMRDSLEIPEGDLFTVIETWDDGNRILKSMDTILEIEDVAAKQTQGMPGVTELLAYLKDQDVKVGLVTRNTEYSVDMFFQAIGEHHKPYAEQYCPAGAKVFPHKVFCLGEALAGADWRWRQSSRQSPCRQCLSSLDSGSFASRLRCPIVLRNPVGEMRWHPVRKWSSLRR